MVMNTAKSQTTFMVPKTQGWHKLNWNISGMVYAHGLVRLTLFFVILGAHYYDTVRIYAEAQQRNFTDY
jgi:hypothetical protein